jgi:hypothetical protein
MEQYVKQLIEDLCFTQKPENFDNVKKLDGFTTMACNQRCCGSFIYKYSSRQLNVSHRQICQSQTKYSEYPH